MVFENYKIKLSKLAGKFVELLNKKYIHTTYLKLTISSNFQRSNRLYDPQSQYEKYNNQGLTHNFIQTYTVTPRNFKKISQCITMNEEVIFMSWKTCRPFLISG